MRKSGWLKGLGVLALVLTISGVSWGQYIPLRILGEGDVIPPTATTVQNVDNPSTSANGNFAFSWDDGASPENEGLVVNGDFVLITGDIITGVSGLLDNVDTPLSIRMINNAGQAIIKGDTNFGTTTEDDFIALYDPIGGTTALAVEDGASPIAGRLWDSWSESFVDDAGNVYSDGNIDGSTTDDDILVLFAAGGGASVISMNVASTYQEGALIVGGALDGETWDSAPFTNLTGNAGGAFVVDGNLDELGGTTTTTDDVLIRHLPGSDYELLLRAGDLVDTPLGGLLPLEFINENTIADNGDVVADCTVDTATTTDEVVIAWLGAAAPQVIAQEDQDISALTGIVGTTIGLLNGVDINSNGQIIFLANVDDDGTNIPPYDEAMFFWEAGVLSIAFTDEIPAAGGVLVDLDFASMAINDLGEIFFQGDRDTTTQDAVWRAIVPTVLPVAGLACGPGGTPDQILASWTNPQAYDGIRIYENSSLVATLPGGDTSYTTAMVGTPTLFVIEVEPFVGADDAPIISCSGTAVVAPDFTECQSPGSAIDSTLPPVVDVFTVATNVLIDDLTIFMDITHTFQADLDMDITSPAGTTVVLSTDNGGGNDNVLTTWADFGNPISSNLNDFDYTQPEGPGTMADFKCEQSGGDWTLVVDDDAGGDIGTLNQWCVNIYESTNNLDCCPKPTLFSCANVGACGGPAAELTWAVNSPYDLLQLIKDDGVTQTTIPLATTDTAYTDLAVVDGTSYTYTLQYTCQGGSLVQDANSCSVAVDVVTVPAVTDLVCSPDFCTNVVSLSWNSNGVGYTSLTLNRAGVFLADVTGLQSFDDTSPVIGQATYSIIADCGGSTAATNCVVDNSLAAPSSFGCVVDPVLCNGVVTVTWTNEASYDALDLLIDGVAPSSQPVPGDTAYTTAPLGSGLHTIELTASCGGNGVSVTCDVTVFVPPTGETDCILALEGLQSADFGDVDSVSALQASLLANGRTVYVTAPDGGTIDTSLPCGVVLADFDRVWVMTGTFPDDYRITAAEGDFLAAANQAGAGMYFEAGDHWGFIHVVSGIDARDGVEEDIGANIADGNDGFVLMDAQDSGIGVDLTVPFPAPVTYGQDQVGTDFTDQLSVTGTNPPPTATPDAEVMEAGALFRNSDVAADYITTILAHNLAGGSFISSSWEFGGFGLDPLDPAASDPLRATLAAEYVAALGGVPPMDQFIRGDCNSDLGFNIADAIYTLAALFSGGPPGPCLEACDANSDAAVNIADAVYTLAALFSGGPPPAAPHPDCGAGTGALPCDTLPACP